MQKVQRSEILDYETYEEQREGVRAQILKTKEPRRIHVGDHLTFLFENTDTVRYQIQEMVRTERLVKESAIQHEVDTYNELLGESGELGCVLLIEYPTPEERDVQLRKLLGLPAKLYMTTENGKRAYAQFDARQVGEQRLSSVQYLKFDTQGSAPVSIGTEHPEMMLEFDLLPEQKTALKADLV
jgi:hypothetical protein